MISSSYVYLRGTPVKVFSRSLLPALIASILASPLAMAEDDCVELEGAPAGLYATTDEGTVFMVGADGQIVDLPAGSSGFADENQAKCISRPPRFLDWPCSTQAAQSRMFNTYTLDELESDNKLDEIVQRYFDIPEVLAPIPNWIDGEYNAPFNYNELVQFSSPEYWYNVNPNVQVLSPKRPRSLLVSLYVGTNQVVLDANVIDALRSELGSDELPVTFLFADSNTVPVSYFGNNVSLEEVFKAFKERGIKVADVPMWWLGDYHLLATVEEFEKFFEVPQLEDLKPEKVSAIQADLEANGFTKKPLIVTMFSETGAMALDQPGRLRIASSIGIKRIPTVFNFIEPDIHLARCGPGTPVGSGAVSGSTTPVGGASVPADVSIPPQIPEVPPPPQPASPSQTSGNSG